MRYRYLDDFRRGISVFAIFSYGIPLSVERFYRCILLKAKNEVGNHPSQDAT